MKKPVTGRMKALRCSERGFIPPLRKVMLVR